MRALRVNRMRSALTMLGIIIGVAAVIAMVAVGSGATARIQEQIQSIGSNLIIVLPGSITSGRHAPGQRQRNVTLTEDDAKAIAAECPAVPAVAPMVRGGAQVIYGNANWATTIQGITPDYLTVRDYTMGAGNPFTAQDVDSAAKVALLGQTVAQNLFGDSRPGGPGDPHQERAVHGGRRARPKGQSPSGQDQDDIILIPISTAKKKVLGANQANAALGRLHDGAGRRPAISWTRPSAKSRGCCASATACRPGRTTISPSATSRRSSPRRKAPRA